MQERLVAQEEFQSPLHAVMSQLGIELWNLSDSMGGIESAVHRVVAGGGQLAFEDLSDLQAIDVVQQTLQALAEFALGIAASVPSELSMDVSHHTNQIKLQDLANRLALKHFSQAPELETVIFD